MRKLLAAYLVVATSSVFGAVISELEFEGLVRLSPDVASEMIGISKGDNVDIEMIDEAVKKLYKQNYFEDIWVEDEGEGKLVFHFVEKPVIANIEVTGIGENDQEEILGVIALKKGEVYDAEKADLAKLKIIKHYEQKGYFDTVVEVSQKEISKGALSLDFIINRGEEIFIQEVQLCGAQNLDYDDIEPVIANKAPEILPWMWGFNDGKLRLSDLEFDSARIKDIYMQNGYMDAVVSSPYLKAYMDSYSAKLTYTIDEGKQYKIGKVDINMPEGLIAKEELLENILLQEGQVFNIKRLRSDMESIKKSIADLGYAYARVFPNIDSDKEKGITNITVSIIPGQKVYINEVRISGNTRTIDRVVRREVYLANGDLYSKTDLDDSLGALKRSSYFQDVKIEEKRVSNDKIDLIVHVTEANTGTIGGGIGYGSSDGLLLSANVSDTNIFGSGLKASVDVDRSDSELSGGISLTNPRVFDSVYSLGGRIYRSETDYSYDSTTDYTATRTGFSLTAGRRFGRHWSASLGYIIENKEYSDIDDDDDDDSDYDELIAELYPDMLKSSIVPAISFNNTDDYYLPRKGMSFKSSLEFAGLGGDAEFAKSVTKFNYYYGLKDVVDYDLIFRYKSQFQYLIENGDIPIDEYISMGGISSIRGYDSGSIGPIKTLTVDGEDYEYYNGNMMFANSIEASFPLISRLKMRGAVFFDYGIVGRDSLSIDRASTGINLEWVSPMGPILLIFAKPLLEEAGDDTSTFEFTMGRTF